MARLSSAPHGGRSVGAELDALDRSSPTSSTPWSGPANER